VLVEEIVLQVLKVAAAVVVVDNQVRAPMAPLEEEVVGLLQMVKLAQIL
jgi:hypothetical protein